MNRSRAGNIIKTQINAGKLFVGGSAGAVLVAPNIEYTKDVDDHRVAPLLQTYDALDIIDFYPESMAQSCHLFRSVIHRLYLLQGKISKYGFVLYAR